jgi:hypothetical protein
MGLGGIMVVARFIDVLRTCSGPGVDAEITTRLIEAACPLVSRVLSHSSTSECRHAMTRSVISVGCGKPRVRRIRQSVGLLIRSSRQTSLTRRY